MQKNKKRELMKSNLAEELEWYTLYASEEEYDEKAVESILYLLDRWEPLEEGTVPPVEESWKRFLQVAGRKELLPVEDAAVKRKPAEEGVAAERKLMAEDTAMEWKLMVENTAMGRKLMAEDTATERKLMAEDTATERKLMVEDVAAERKPVAEAERTAVQEEETGEGLIAMKQAEGSLTTVKATEGGRSPVREAEYGLASGEGTQEAMPAGIAERVSQGQEDKPGNTDAAIIGKRAGRKKAGKLARFAARHKIIAAAVLVLMVLMVGNTIHAVANPGTGFFFWLDRDESGVKMMTSPEGLDDRTNKQENIFYNRNDVPEWAQGWIEIETEIEVETQGVYELQYFEISESETRQHVASYFLSEDIKREIVVGVWVYWDKVSYFKEEFLDYDYVQSYEFDHKEMDIYKKTEDSGQVYYTVCFYDENCKYYVKGWENLDEIKKMAEDYWNCVKKNS